jgi:hypothetical protein
VNAGWGSTRQWDGCDETSPQDIKNLGISEFVIADPLSVRIVWCMDALRFYRLDTPAEQRLEIAEASPSAGRVRRPGGIEIRRVGVLDRAGARVAGRGAAEGGVLLG